MAQLTYTAIASLDGYVRDAQGGFEWAVPDEEVHAFVNDLERPVGTHLYGRGLYEVMVAWETIGDDPDESPAVRDYAAIWKAADKVVYSRTLDAPSSARTTIERDFDPDAVRGMKAASPRDLSIGGPGLAGQAIAAGLVDEYRLFVHPVVVGGGLRWLPDGVRLDLDLIEERRFASGVVYLRYRAA
ncbi:MAG TPA: dihydrofolate reductase family protein [Actinomycetota bacterium]|jgi:dihydrofolate reductase